MPQIWVDASGHPVTCNGCGKKFSIEHVLSCPKGWLVLVRHDDAAKEWVALGVRALIPTVDFRFVGNSTRDEGPGSKGAPLLCRVTMPRQNKATLWT